MTDQPPKDEKPDDAAFQRTLENMLKAPHKPHVPVKNSGEPPPPGERDDR